MKIKVELEIEVDPLKWAAFNNIPESWVKTDICDFLSDVLSQTNTFAETGSELIRAVAHG